MLAQGRPFGALSACLLRACREAQGGPSGGLSAGVRPAHSRKRPGDAWRGAAL